MFDNSSSSQLQTQQCEPCHANVPPLNPEQIDRERRALSSDWQVVENKKLTKNFIFTNFRQAIAFINCLAKAAEYQGHHPEISLHDYKEVKIEWWTHFINGLHHNDFIMAAKTDLCFEQSKSAVSSK